MGVISTIKEWGLPDDRTFDILAWDDIDFIPVELFNQTKDSIRGLGGENPGQCFFRFPYPTNLAKPYIHHTSVALMPINEWAKVDHMWASCSLFWRKNDMNLLDIPEYRLLVHMKFRGMVPGGALFTDSKNIEKIVSYPISSTMPINQCVVFEYELSGRNVRNYFYNSSKREFVNSGKPSWIPDALENLHGF